jgi:hypothetical protein
MSHLLEQKVWPTQDEEGKFRKEIGLVKRGQNRLRKPAPASSLVKWENATA